MPESERIRDRDLLKRFRAGDRDAFTQLYRENQRAVFRFALLMTGDEPRAAEATQDVFVWLIHHPEKFDPERGELVRTPYPLARADRLRERGVDPGPFAPAPRPMGTPESWQRKR